MAGLAIGVVLYNGLGAFWPAHIAQVRLQDGQVILGQQVRTSIDPATGRRTVQFKTANRELDPQRMDFHWYPQESIREQSYPEDVFMLERVQDGAFIRFLERLEAPGLELPNGAAPAR